MSDTKEVAQNSAIKNKVLFVTCISFILLSLFLVCYMLFFRSITIDVSKDMKLEYSGESGSASVTVLNDAHNLNQRTQEFIDSITYQVSPNRNLSNGSNITIQASWSESLADKYNIEVINDVTEITVEGLTQRFENANAIPATLLDTLDTKATAFFDRNTALILKEDFSKFTDNTVEVKKRDLLYRIYLQAMDTENKDKIMDFYQIEATGNVTDKQGNVTSETEQMYYAVTYDNINDSQRIEDKDIYGEKMSITQLQSQEDLVEALKGKYLLSYTMSILN